MLRLRPGCGPVAAPVAAWWRLRVPLEGF